MSQISPAKLADLVYKEDPNLLDEVMQLTRRASAISEFVDDLTLDVHVLRRHLEEVVESVAAGDPDAQWAAYTYSGMRNLVELIGAMRRQCADIKNDTTAGEVIEIQKRNWRGKHFVPAWALVDAPDNDEIEGS
ncbi:MAG: hypothetical protein M3O70_08215 [Actinomycetota bacterium]|nr:hypothetical protein [Actinomycetota bacterium]